MSETKPFQRRVLVTVQQIQLISRDDGQEFSMDEFRDSLTDSVNDELEVLHESSDTKFHITPIEVHAIGAEELPEPEPEPGS